LKTMNKTLAYATTEYLDISGEWKSILEFSRFINSPRVKSNRKGKPRG